MRIKTYHNRKFQIIAVHIPNTTVQIRNPSTLISSNNLTISLQMFVDILVSEIYKIKCF